ncbi:MAG: DUF177 domain-containing protein [Acidimicrobiia bacterium]|nr:DUF177 domain-containing protein [Acidimicrobiia bacterium]
MKGRDLRISVTELLRRPGTRREVARTFTSPGYLVAASTVPEGSDIVVDLVVESTAQSGTLTVTGTVAAPWEGECRRCLADVHGTLEIDVREVFSHSPDALTDDDVWPLEGEEIDLDEVVGESILLALPLAPLCGPDCKGPALDEFPARIDDDTTEDGSGPLADPRWAALDQLHFD